MPAPADDHASKTAARPAGMARLGVLDAEFLHMEDERQPLHIAGLCIFEGPPPAQEDVRRALAAKLGLIPRYRQRARFLPLEIGRPIWVDDPAFDLGYHVRRAVLPAPGDDAALCALMGQLMAQLLDRNRPLWELWIIEGLEGGRWALLSKVHHAMVDGISAVDVTEVLLDAQADSPLPAPVDWLPALEPSGVAKVLDAWRGLAQDAWGIARRTQALLRHPAVGAHELRDSWTGLLTFARRLLILRTGELQGSVGKRRSYAHASASLDDIQAIRRAFGGTVNDVVLAAVSAGYRTLLQSQQGQPVAAPIRSLIPVSTRASSEHGALANRVSALLCDLPVHIEDPVERLRAVRAETERLKASHMAQVGAQILDLGALAPPFVMGAVTRLATRIMHRIPQRIFATVTTNVPGPRVPLYCLGRRMLEWHPYVPIGQGLRVGTAILSYAGRLSFGVTSDRDTIQDASVVARGIVQGITELRDLARSQAATAPAGARSSTAAAPVGSPPSAVTAGSSVS